MANTSVCQIIRTIYRYQWPDLGKSIPGQHLGGIAEDILPGWFSTVGCLKRGLNSRIIRRVNHMTINPYLIN
jgi:hypothetical protein